jgi:flavin reductase (DIM6/NTAB) family NADH-FMN oxidoreductase RutF
MTLPADLGLLRHQAIRRFTTGVAVLTIWHGETAHGATVSSVATLSREPLLIGASLRTGSAFAQAVGTARRFAVNVLSDRQAALAGWFATPERPHGLAQFDHLDWEPDTFSGAPWIKGSLASVGCWTTDIIPTGDHHLILAEVVTARLTDGAPLLHFTGRLHEGKLRVLPREKTHEKTHLGDGQPSTARPSTARPITQRPVTQRTSPQRPGSQEPGSPQPGIQRPA